MSTSQPAEAATNADPWKPLTFVMIRGEKHEFTDFEISLQMREHKLELNLEEKQRKFDELRSAAEAAWSRADDFLEEIHACHAKMTDLDDCSGCEGRGTVPDIADRRHFGGSLDPVESVAMIVCEDCRGSKKEWVAS